jgi:hypothetical protein
MNMNEPLVTGCTALTSSTLCYDPDACVGTFIALAVRGCNMTALLLAFTSRYFARWWKIHTTHSRHNLPQRSLTSQPLLLWTQSSASDHPFPGFVTTPLASRSSGQLGPVIRFAPAVSGVLSGASPLHPNHPPCSS